ncbi:HalOD1 output domain-containing protein [Halomarina halobia]|uniref:HalOD1 output domain-containing protein n=1 Tax=Halomarina halobia TaxID=3033386 RepID=A0ABD6AG78_9EURY|nr:HalOD1 output domain-containing protein [Halomarina sp. PSR21]
MVRGDGRVHETALSTAIVEAIAAEKQVDPIRLDPPLHDVVDPDALDEMFSVPNSVPGYVAFEYDGYQVEAHSDGRVTLSPLTESSAATLTSDN